MGFEGYNLGLAFVHKGVVAEFAHLVLWGHVGFLEKGRSTDWVGQTHSVLVVDGVIRTEVALQHEGAPRMEFVLQWEDSPQHWGSLRMEIVLRGEDAPQFEVEFSGSENQT